MTPGLSRWTKGLLWALGGLLALAALAFAGLWIAARVVAPDHLKDIIETSASRFLGRKLTIESLAAAPFPRLELRARDVRLHAPDGRVIIAAPAAVAFGSVISVFKLRLGVEEIRLENPEINLWYEKDGRLNAEHIVAEIRARPKSGAKRSVGKLFFHRFSVAEGRLRLSDVAGAPPVIDGRVHGQVALPLSLLGLRGAPFELKVDEGEGGAFLEATGRIGGSPRATVRGQRVPARALSPRVESLRNCTGAADLRLDWTGGRKSRIDFALSPAALCADAGPLPERLSGTIKHERGGWALDLVATASRTHVSAAATLPPPPAAISVDVTGERADAPSVAGWARTLSGLRSRGAAVAPPREANVNVAVASVTWRNVLMTNVDFRMNRSTTAVTRVSPARLDLLGGRAEGALEIRDGRVAADLRAHGLSLAELNAAFSSTAALTGRLSLSLSGHSPLGAPVISSFTGRGEAWVSEFELERVPAILKTLTSANFITIERQVKGEKKGPFPPATGNAQMDLTSGVAHVHKLSLENRLLEVGFTGRVNYVSRQLDGTMVLHALTGADQIINDIPILGKLLLGDGKSFLPLWFQVRGPWHDPQVRSLPSKSIETPVWNVFRGIIDLPQDIFDKIRGK